MSFIIAATLPVLDMAYTVANMHVCSTFSGDSQALAGSIFSVATRVTYLSISSYTKYSPMGVVTAWHFDRVGSNFKYSGFSHQEI